MYFMGYKFVKLSIFLFYLQDFKYVVWGV